MLDGELEERREYRDERKKVGQRSRRWGLERAKEEGGREES